MTVASGDLFQDQRRAEEAAELWLAMDARPLVVHWTGAAPHHLVPLEALPPSYLDPMACYGQPGRVGIQCGMLGPGTGIEYPSRESQQPLDCLLHAIGFLALGPKGDGREVGGCCSTPCLVCFI
jgi:hypothetical protein